MSETRQGGAAAMVRPIIMLVLLLGGSVSIWRATHHTEAYVGGDVHTTGVVESDHIRLGFHIPGRILELAVEEGQKVVPGQNIASLESEDQEVALRAARAALESSRAAVAQSVASHAKAAQDLGRARELMRSQATTQQVLDGAVSAEAIAAAARKATVAQSHQAEIAVSQAELQLSYASLRAPAAGTVSERVHLPGEMVAAGTPVVAIAQLDTVKVRAAVDETRVGAVRPGDTAEVHTYTFDKKIFPGFVTDVSPAGDFATRKDWGSKRRDIRTFSVTIRVPNPEGFLKDGMTTDVVIKTSAAAQGAAGKKP